MRNQEVGLKPSVSVGEVHVSLCAGARAPLSWPTNFTNSIARPPEHRDCQADWTKPNYVVVYGLVYNTWNKGPLNSFSLLNSKVKS